MIRSRFLLVAVSVVLAACGGDKGATTEPAVPSFVGVYTLASVNGQNVPALMSQTSTARTEVTDSRLSFNADGTVSEATSFRIVTANSTTTTAGASIGVYTVNGTAAVIRWTSPSVSQETATLNGATLTAASGSSSLVYRKQ